MAAAENWGSHPHESGTLAQQMSRWSEEMATMSEGVPGYASLEGYEAYVAKLRGQFPGGDLIDAPVSNTGALLAREPYAEAAPNEEASGHSGDSSTFTTGVSRVLDRLGLRFG